MLPSSQIVLWGGWNVFLVDWFFLLICLGVIFLFVFGGIFFIFQWSTSEIRQLWSADKSGLPPIFVNEVLLEHSYTHVSSFVCDCPGTNRVKLSDWQRPQNLKYLLPGHCWEKFLDLSSRSLTGGWLQLLAHLCFELFLVALFSIWPVFFSRWWSWEGEV